MSLTQGDPARRIHHRLQVDGAERDGSMIRKANLFLIDKKFRYHILMVE